jgi:ABC-type Fe3+ transport system substrate-binding protein
MKKVTSLLLVVALIMALLSMGTISGCASEAEEPTVTGVNPSSGDAGETLDVTITGTNLTDASAVNFGAGISVNSYTVDSETKITANITVAANATAGSRNVSATTPDGTGTKTGGFTVTVLPGPSVIGVSPSSGEVGDSLNITIMGTNLTDASAVSLGTGITVNSFSVNSATQITASIAIAANTAAGSRDVSVTTPLGTGTATGGFTVTSPQAPTITGVSPDSGEQGDTMFVTITGTNFADASEVSFGAEITVNSFTVTGATINASITIAGTAAEGSRDVSVTNPAGTGLSGDSFTVVMPQALADLIEAAAAEGELNLAFAMPLALVEALQDGINERYGLEVTFNYAPTYNMPAQASRLIDQYNAGETAETDLYLGSESHLPEMNRIGGLAVYDWKDLFPYIPDAAIQLDNTSLEYDSFFQGVSYNSDLVVGDDIPRFAQDILAPKWQGLVSSTPYAAGFTRMADESLFGYEGTKAFLQDLTGQIGGLIGCGDLDRIATGEFYMLFLDCGPGEVNVHAGQGQPVAFTVLEDVAILGHVYVVVPSNAEHPDLSALLAGYLMSQEGQALVNEHWNRGSHHVEGTPQYEEYNEIVGQGITVVDLTADDMNEREDELNAWQYEFILILRSA